MIPNFPRWPRESLTVTRLSSMKLLTDFTERSSYIILDSSLFEGLKFFIKTNSLVSKYILQLKHIIVVLLFMELPQLCSRKLVEDEFTKTDTFLTSWEQLNKYPSGTVK